MEQVTRIYRSSGLRRSRRVGVATLAALSIVLAQAVGAQAGNPAQYLDDGSVVYRTQYVDPAVPEWKERSFELFLLIKDGTATTAQVREFSSLVSANRPSGTKSAQAPMAPSDVLSFTYPTSKSLTQTQRPQTKAYYCGPASGYSVIRSWNAEFGHSTNSAVNGAALSQAQLGTSSYMNTESSTKSTDWLDNEFPHGINTWLGQSFYAQLTVTSATDVSGHVVYDIYNNYMLGSDMHEVAGGAHYNHHPSAKTISHWTTVYGYTGTGSTIKFQDPAANTASGVLGSDWGSVNPYFSLTSDDSYFYMGQNGLPRGLVW